MNIEMISKPANTAGRIRMAQGETILTEVGAMIAMSPGIRVETSSRTASGGGLMRGLKRMFSGENFFINHFTADVDGQELIIGPALAGDMVLHRLHTGRLIVQGGSWLASGPGIDVDTTWQGMARGLLSGEGLFWVNCRGTGDIVISSFGAIYEVDVQDSYMVDTSHIVAFEDTLEFTMGKASDSWFGSFLGGEGIVCKFRGHGKLYCQSHSPQMFGTALGPLLLPRQG